MTPRGASGRAIAGWTIDLPPGWFTVPLDDLDPHEQTRWIDDVVEQLRTMAEEPGSAGALRDELAQVRTQLLAREDPWVSAAVGVRPEVIITVGCVLTTSIIALEEGDDPDALQALLEDGFAHPGRGVRSHAWRVWREEAEAGELVAGYQRFETVRPGEGVGQVEDRTVFGLFAADAAEMIRMEFRSDDLGAFEDMPAQTGAIARTARVELGEAA